MSSYRDHFDNRQRVVCTHSWADHTNRALTFQYGPRRAAAIKAGKDPKTLADIEAWNSLGARRAA